MEIENIELPDVEWIVQDNIFIKQMSLNRAGIFVPQHSHKYDHASMLASGSIRVWCDDILVGDFKAPYPIAIKAGTKHTFQSLEPSIVYCIHNISREDSVEIESEHAHVSDNILSQGA